MPQCYAQQIDHYVTAMQDIDRAEQFYCDLLGGKVKRKRLDYSNEADADPHGTRPPSMFVQLGPIELGLFGDELMGLPYRKLDRGVPRWAYEVATEDFGKLIDRLRAAHVSFDGPEGNEGDDASHIWLHDHEGNYLEIVDRGTPKKRPQDEIEFVRLDRVEYETTDFQRTEYFYTNAMGFEVVGRGRSTEGNPSIDFRLPTSGQVFRFHRVERPSVQTTFQFRGNHLAFYVPSGDYQDACLQIESYGFIQRDERGDAVHGDLRIPKREGEGSGEGTYFFDPNGYKLQYIARPGKYLDETAPRARG
jgi:catechol 2,3-dioxygenase-like lactoylglutathione lyase family enzyme